MNHRHCLKIADRISALLVRELGQGIDRQRMLAEPLYARDVLLVCDAHPGSELAAQARRFRDAMAAAEAAAEQPGGIASRFLHSLFGDGPAPPGPGPENRSKAAARPRRPGR
jgi:hypothetical protein